MATTRSFSETGVGRDLSAIRPFLWLPIATTVIAVVAALVLGMFASNTNEARFRSNVVVDALPPLFGPPILPGPFDYAGLATGDDVIAQVAADTGFTAEDLRPRLRAEPRVNTPEIDFAVTGDDALDIATSWEQSFAASVPGATPALQEDLIGPYREQLEQARAQLALASAAAAASPSGAAEQQLAAAEENYATASRLVQSYEVVAATMDATAFPVNAPHTYSPGLGSGPARVGAAVAIGLVAGVLGACALAFAGRSGRDDDDESQAPPALRAATAVEPAEYEEARTFSRRGQQ